MDRISRKAVFAVAGFVLFLALADTQSAAAQLAAAEPASKKAEEVYDNIQVLKGMPYDQMIPTMQWVSEMLGVKCEFCHDEDRALEGKATKQTARTMFEMVFAINKNTFGGRRAVTCYSCHRGSAETVDVPDWALLFANQELKPKPVEVKEGGRTSPGVLPTVDQLLDKYVAALGGAAALQKIASRVEKGTVTTRRPDRPPSRLPVEIFAKAPDRRFTKAFSVSHLGNSAEAFGVYNGGAGWLREGSSIVRVMFGWRLDAARLEDTLNFPTRVKQLVSELQVDGTEKVGPGEAYVVLGRTQFLPLVKLYFDKDSGLLARLVYYTETVVGSFPTQIDYADYRNVDGQKISFRWTVSLIRGVRATYQLDEVRQNIPIEDSKFAIPTPLPVLYR